SEGAQRSQLALLGAVHFAAHEAMKLLEQRLGVGERLAFDGGSHERRRSFRDGAALALEADIVDRVAGTAELDPERERVAAERVATLDRAIGARHFPKVALLPVVLEDQLLVERLRGGRGIAHTPVTRTARAPSAPTSRALPRPRSSPARRRRRRR